MIIKNTDTITAVTDNTIMSLRNSGLSSDPDYDMFSKPRAFAYTNKWKSFVYSFTPRLNMALTGTY